VRGLLLKLAEAALRDEEFAATVYRRIAELQGGPLKGRLLEMAMVEERHASFWREFLRKRGVEPKFAASRIRTTLYAIAAKVLGVGLTLRLLEAGERNAVELYSRILESGDLTDRERHMLEGIIEDELLHEDELAREESKFEEFISHIRDAVLGMNDGLVEVLSVSMGLVGAYGDPLYVALGGLIVGAAGALSMGVGAFASVRAQRQVQESMLRRVAIVTKYARRALKRRLLSRLVSRGYSDELSKALADEVLSKPPLLSKLLAEEEYGIREEQLEDPVKAGLYTGSSYMVGALAPLLPYLFGLPIHISMPLSLLFAGALLGLTGIIIAITAGLTPWKKSVELILAGFSSALATFIIGRLASALLGIELG